MGTPSWEMEKVETAAPNGGEAGPELTSKEEAKRLAAVAVGMPSCVTSAPVCSGSKVCNATSPFAYSHWDWPSSGLPGSYGPMEPQATEIALRQQLQALEDKMAQLGIEREVPEDKELEEAIAISKTAEATAEISEAAMALKQHGYDDTTAVRKLMRAGQGFPKKIIWLLNSHALNQVIKWHFLPPTGIWF